MKRSTDMTTTQRIALVAFVVAVILATWIGETRNFPTNGS